MGLRSRLQPYLDSTSRIVLLVSLPLLTGCFHGSLASDTGWSTEGDWSAARTQDAHVGETVNYSFIIREGMREGRVSVVGLADYAAAEIGGDRVEMGPDRSQFKFEHTLGNAIPGQTLHVNVAAYAIKERKDHMFIQGKWVKAESPFDLPDKMVASDAIKLRVYQSRIDYAFDVPQTELDWATARLVITRRDNKVSTILMHKPDHAGFTVSGPDRSGRCHVQYEPTAEQVNNKGTTTAALHIRDVQGQQHTYPIEFETP